MDFKELKLTRKGKAFRAKAIEAARQRYASDDINIDDDANLSLGDDGVWVQAWVFVPAQDLE